MKYTLNELKIMLLTKIKESKMSKSDRIKLVEYIDNADMVQTKHLLLYGTMVENTKSVSERQMETLYESKDVQQALKEAGGRIAQARKTYFSAANSPVGAIVAGVGGAAATGGVSLATGAASAGIWALYRMIRAKYDKCTKSCGTFEINTARRQHCMLKCKIGKLQQNVAAAEKNGNQSEVSKNKAKLAKAQAAFQKMENSFKARGAKLPSEH